jgi:hypothetical protein
MKQHAIFLRTGCLLPLGLGLIQEQFCEKWMSVENTTVAALDVKVRNAGWHFMWLTDADSCLGIGRTAESARNSAMSLALKKVRHCFNAAELISIKTTKYPWFQFARATIQSRQIQQHTSLVASTR